MKFISAGHCNVKGPNNDPGAPGVDKRWEADETVNIRDLVISRIRQMGYLDIVQDLNGESLGQYLKRVKPGSGSVVVEFHFNAGPASATGTEVLVSVDADRLDKSMAQEFAEGTAHLLGITNRGVKSEADTRHKRLGLMRETGIVNLVEICFITSENDMKQYDKNISALADLYAGIIIKYDAIIK